MNGLLLDIHVWIWYAEGVTRRLSSEAVARIEEVRKQSRLFVSAVSVLEIGMLHNRRKLTLSAPLDIWVGRASALPELRPLPLDGKSALESTQLPGSIHGDPADRFLVTIARVAGLHLMAADTKIIDYALDAYVAGLGKGDSNAQRTELRQAIYQACRESDTGPALYRSFPSSGLGMQGLEAPASRVGGGLI